MEIMNLTFEVKEINMKEDNISLHQSLLKDPDREKQIMVTGNNMLPLLYPPIFIEQIDSSYQLIGRHWSYAMLVTNTIYEFIGIIVHDENSIPQIIDILRMEIAIFKDRISSHLVSPSIISRATRTRHQSKAAGQVCPFCSGALRKCRTKEVVDGKGYRIGCENRSNRNINNGSGCDFEAVLTETEYKLFKEYQFPTTTWFIKIAGKKCPKCGDQVYKRIVHKHNGNEEFERCKKWNTKGKECKYSKKLFV